MASFVPTFESKNP